ncbi:MAG TPA: mannitol-1-phosphate 5-dehydrogenase [Thermaerobacter sp.]
MRAVHFGAGNIGRGFIGLLLARSGYRVCFVDVKPELLALLRSRRRYTVRVLGYGEGGPVTRTEVVEGFEALDARDRDAVAGAIAGADLVTTSVGAGVLESIAPLIAEGLRRRGPRPLNVIACENLLGAGDKLREAVARELGEAPRHAGFPNAVVDRIVPNAAGPRGDDPLEVAVEEYHEWLVDARGIVEPAPAVTGMQVVDDLHAYAERKLFGLNGGHAIVAYLGHLRGHATIDRAARDPLVRATLLGALVETGLLLTRRHGFGESEQARYSAALLRRFENPALADAVQRVGREPLRKLAAGDRLVRPARLALEEGIWPVCLARGIAAGYLFDAPEDPQARELRARVERDGLAAALAAVSGIEPGSLLGELVQEEYRRLSRLRHPARA